MVAAETLDLTEIEAWGQDLDTPDEAGETLFNLTQYRHIVRKPE